MKATSFIFLIIAILLLPVVMSYSIIGIHQIFGQAQTTPAQQTTQQQEQQQGALRWVPQDAIIVTKTPDGFFQGNGQSIGGGLTVEGLITSGITSGIAYGISKLDNRKNQKNIQSVAGTQVKVIETVEGVNNQTFENMPDKGASITNKPETQQNTVTKLKDEAIKTAAQS